MKPVKRVITAKRAIQSHLWSPDYRDCPTNPACPTNPNRPHHGTPPLSTNRAPASEVPATRDDEILGQHRNLASAPAPPTSGPTVSRKKGLIHPQAESCASVWRTGHRDRKCYRKNTRMYVQQGGGTREYRQGCEGRTHLRCGVSSWRFTSM